MGVFAKPARFAFNETGLLQAYWTVKLITKLFKKENAPADKFNVTFSINFCTIFRQFKLGAKSFDSQEEGIKNVQ